MISGNDRLFNQANCKGLEEIDWSKVGSYKIDTSTNPIYFNSDQWVVSDVF